MDLTRNRINFLDYIIIGGVWFSAIVSLMADSINMVALYVVLPFVFILTFLSTKSIRFNRYMKLFSLLFIWILISVLWASNIDYAMIQVNQMLGSILLCYVISEKGRKEKILPYLYFTFLILLLGDWYYAYNNMFGILEFGTERLNDLKLNANTFGYHTFYATFAVFMLGEWDSGIKRLMQIIFLIMIPLSFITAIYTASRQILLIQVPLFIFLLYGRYYKTSRPVVKFISLSLFVLLCVVLIPKATELYEGSFLQQRNEVNVKDDVRILLMKDAFKVGNKHFPFGVGANNYMEHSITHQISHNTYLELYANEGVIGVALYSIMLFIFIQKQWKRYRRTKDIMFYYLFVAGVIFAFDGLFYVFYPHLWLISFFILIATHSETYYKHKYALQ